MRPRTRLAEPRPKRAPAVASSKAPVILHAALPGRLRFHLPGWLPGERAVLERRLGMIPGVREASAAPDTGNVLLLYDPKVTDPRRLTQAAARAVVPEKRRRGPVSRARGDCRAPTDPGSPPTLRFHR
jgi:hypothetical protein